MSEKPHREEPIQKGKFGRVNCWVYVFTASDGMLDHRVECFYWRRPSQRSSWRQDHRIEKGDFLDYGKALEWAYGWTEQHPVRPRRAA